MAWFRASAACGLVAGACLSASAAWALPPPQAATVNIVRSPDAPQEPWPEQVFAAMAYGGAYGGAFNVTVAPSGDAALAGCAAEDDQHRRGACVRALPRQTITVLVSQGPDGALAVQCIGTGVGPSNTAQQTIRLEPLSWPSPGGPDTEAFRRDRNQVSSCVSAAQTEQQAAPSAALAIAAVVRGFGEPSQGADAVSWDDLERHTPGVTWDAAASQFEPYVHRRSGRLGDVTVTACGSERHVIWLNLRQPDSGDVFGDNEAVLAALDQTGAERTLEMIEGAGYDNRARVQYPGGRLLRVYRPRGAGSPRGANTTVTHAAPGYVIPVGIPREWGACLGVVSEVR